jgi:hypothetical protein
LGIHTVDAQIFIDQTLGVRCALRVVEHGRENVHECGMMRLAGAGDVDLSAALSVSTKSKSYGRVRRNQALA